jgi:hypothetical protein
VARAAGRGYGLRRQRPIDVLVDVPGLDELKLPYPLSDRLAAARRLGDFTLEQLRDLQGERTTELRALLLAIVSRATNTYEAVLHLCEGGYSEQAVMLTRPLFEAMVDAYWAAEKGDDAVDLVEKQRLHARVRAAETTRDAPEHQRVTVTGAQRAEAQKLNKLFGSKGKKHWTTERGLEARVQTIEASFPEEWPGRLRAFLNEENQYANWLLHGSSLAFDVAVRRPLNGELALVQLGPSEEYTPDALWAATWMAHKLAWLVLTQFGRQAREQELHALFLDALRTLATAPVGELWRAGLDDPCPCGTELRAGECHKGHDAQARFAELDLRLESFAAFVKREPDEARVAQELQRVVDEFAASLDAPRKRPPPQGRRRGSGKKRGRR